MNKYDKELSRLLDELSNDVRVKNLTVVDLINKAVSMESAGRVSDAGQMSSKKVLSGLKRFRDKVENGGLQ